MKTYTPLTDEQLVGLLKKGDQQAFTEIYKRYAAKLAGFATSKLYNIDDARDILHDMFVKLWEGREQLHITANLQSYLFSIIRHRIIDKIRKNITREEYAAAALSLQKVYNENAEKEIEVKDLQQTIQKLLNELPPRVREIYKLSREQGLSNGEIAVKLELSEQTVKNQLSTALKHLRKSLSGFAAVAFIIWGM